MYFEGTFRHIGTVDPQPLADAIEALGEGSWFEYVRRQETFQPHRRTQTIPLLYDEDGRHADPTTWPRMTDLKSVIEPVLAKIREANASTAGNGEDGYFIRIILTRLAPHGWIPRHRDGGPSLLRSHRYHVALVTNPGVEFEVGDDVEHLVAGAIWEINNRQLHAVRNTSDEARVHLILDYVVPGETVDDPEGVVTA